MSIKIGTVWNYEPFHLIIFCITGNKDIPKRAMFSWKYTTTMDTGHICVENNRYEYESIYKLKIVIFFISKNLQEIFCRI